MTHNSTWVLHCGYVFTAYQLIAVLLYYSQINIYKQQNKPGYVLLLQMNVQWLLPFHLRMCYDFNSFL